MNLHASQLRSTPLSAPRVARAVLPDVATCTSCINACNSRKHRSWPQVVALFDELIGENYINVCECLLIAWCRKAFMAAKSEENFKQCWDGGANTFCNSWSPPFRPYRYTSLRMFLMLVKWIHHRQRAADVHIKPRMSARLAILSHA